MIIPLVSPTDIFNKNWLQIRRWRVQSMWQTPLEFSHVTWKTEPFLATIQGDHGGLRPELGWLRFVKFLRLLGCYYSYLLPTQHVGTPQIYICQPIPGLRPPWSPCISTIVNLPKSRSHCTQVQRIWRTLSDYLYRWRIITGLVAIPLFWTWQGSYHVCLESSDPIWKSSSPPSPNADVSFYHFTQ